MSTETIGTELVPATSNAPTTSLSIPSGIGYFGSLAMFEDGQRMAKMFAFSPIVPETFAVQTVKRIKNEWGKIISEEPMTKEEYNAEVSAKIGSCLIALDMAARLNINPLAVMQNIYVVYNRPAWSAQFLIACINQSGLFSTPLRYQFSGTGDDYGCVAWALDKSGERLDSTRITIALAKSEGWHGKNGSKWKTMPEQMLRYRAATFFARAYCPELTMGMQTSDEVIDIESAPVVEPKAASTVKPVIAKGTVPVDPKVEKLLAAPTPEPNEAEIPLFAFISYEIGVSKSKGALSRLGNEIAAGQRDGELTEDQAVELNQQIKDRLEEI